MAVFDEMAQQQEVAVQKRKQDLQEPEGGGGEVREDGMLDIWSTIQASKKRANVDLPPPYVHPLIKRSSSFLSQKSLEICTESLGSESGSDALSDDLEGSMLSPKSSSDKDEVDIDDGQEEKEEEGEVEGAPRKKDLATVNYHCSATSRWSPPRSFPPPLPSISRRDGPCLHMRPHRRDGRLVVQAVPVPSQNYLHCQRQDGRLLLSFIETSFEQIYPEISHKKFEEEEEEEETEEVIPEEGEGESGEQQEHVEEEEEDEEEGVEEESVGEEEEEVEVVDRGIVVEVKVSRQPQLQVGGMKVHRSSLVINKFVSGTPPNTPKEDNAKAAADQTRWLVPEPPAKKTAEVVAAEAPLDCWGSASGGQQRQQQQQPQPQQEKKLLLTSKKMMNRQTVLHQVRRCSQHYRPLFIFEPCCVATT